MTHSNRFAERLMITGSSCALVGGVTVLDGTVRSHVVGAVTGGGLRELGMATSALQRTVLSVAESVGYQGTEHGTLSMFAIAAVVLFVFMFRV